METQEITRLARKYALLNAIGHGGIANPGAVIGRIMAEHYELRSQSKLVTSLAQEVVAEVNRKEAHEQSEMIENEFPGTLQQENSRRKEISEKDSERKQTLAPLPGAEVGSVVTRFPPEPNGFMHIGHAKAAIFGSEYAKLYHGRFLLRFDDTNPAAEKAEYYGAFLESFAWLGLKPDEIKYASDDMEKFYALGQKLILNSKGYVCLCTQETMRELRGKGKTCEHRKHSTEKNAKLWLEMISGQHIANSATLRFVGDMTNLNTTLRDPVLFRIVDKEHPRQSNRYKVWPTYDFDGPVEDSLDGVTHAMRSKEYELRDAQYYEILDSLQMRKPQIVEFSRLALKDTTMSKRKLRKLVDEGLVDSWDDPRLPTISGLKRRGILPEAIRTFVLSMGLSKVESQPTWDYLESINRKILDPIAPRYFFVPDPIALKVEGAPDLKVTLPKHPDNENLGTRSIETFGSFLVPRSDLPNITIGSTVRLIEAYNVKITAISDEGTVGSYVGNGQVRDIPKVQWVAGEDSLPLEVWIPGPLTIGEEFNPNSLSKIKGAVEKAYGPLPLGEIVQFVRFGFCRRDSKDVAILCNK